MVLPGDYPADTLECAYPIGTAGIEFDLEARAE
jgi:hypothetical protein